MNPKSAVEVTAQADAEIRQCLNASEQRSFFLYAGAGSGKTRALVEALKWMRRNRREELFIQGRRLAVVTYTNAATDEIKRRIEFDPFVAVSTIHAFAWDLIAGFDDDIRSWLRGRLQRSIDDLMAEQKKGKANTKTGVARALSIQSKSLRLNSIERVKRFVYSPTGDNSGLDALAHAEVIGICSDFLKSKQTLRQILMARFPVMFVDESQDTSGQLMDALLDVQISCGKGLCIGLFGDTMQRIYADGKVDLANAIPETWARPAKLINFRCPERVLQLINKIRAQADGQVQFLPPDATKPGLARFFIANSATADRMRTEAIAADRMAEIANIPAWPTACKRLILEHHMAATRLGFADLFDPLYEIDRYKTGLLDGSLPEMNLLTTQVLEVLRAIRSQDSFRLASLLRIYSPILSSGLSGRAQKIQDLELTRRGVEELRKLLESKLDPTIGDVLGLIKKTGLLELPPLFQAILKALTRAGAEPVNRSEDAGEIQAWDSVLSVGFSQVGKYADYIAGASPFDTHQGVKGLEFPHVMVIIDDSGARGFLFSYDKLFGLKAKSETDRKNEMQGAETGIDRTRRLLYVTCSRAQNSLAIVAYCQQPSTLKGFLVSSGWFKEEEVEILVAPPSS